MKFKINSKKLSQKLQSLLPVIGAKPVIESLSNFLILAKEDKLTITASNLENTLVVTINEVDVLDDGVYTIPARMLTDSIRQIGDKEIEVTCDNSAIIRWDSGLFNIPCFPSDDFPVMPQKEGEKNIIDTEILRNGINSTLYAVGDDELRPIMNGVFIDLINGNFVGSDGFKLSVYTTTPIDCISFVIPKKTAQILHKLLSDGNTELSLNDKNAFFIFDDYQLSCQLVRGTYPKYQSIIPHDNINHIVVNRSKFLSALKRVSVCAYQERKIIAIEIAENKVLVESKNVDFRTSASEELSCVYAGEEILIGFASEILVDILSNLECDNVCIDILNGDKPVLLRPVDCDNVFAIAMPLKL